MKPKGPLATLAVGAVLAAGLLVADFSLSQKEASVAASASASPSASASSSPSATASPSPTATPAVSAVAASSAAPVTYAGKVTGGGSLAVTVKGASAVAYLCDGRTEAWWWGSATATSVSLQDRAGGTLTGRRGGGRLTGWLTVGGRTWSFSLATVTRPSGLYRATATVRGAKVVGGWVVLPDGSQVGAWTADGARVTPAPPLDPATGAVTLDGAALTARPAEPTTNS